MSAATETLQVLINEVSLRETYGWIDEQRQIAETRILREALDRVRNAEQQNRSHRIVPLYPVNSQQAKEQYTETPSMFEEFPESHRALIGRPERRLRW